VVKVDLLPLRPEFDPRPVHLTFVEDKVTDRFSTEYIGLPLSVLFHQYSILNSIYKTFLPEGQTGEA